MKKKIVHKAGVQGLGFCLCTSRWVLDDKKTCEKYGWNYDPYIPTYLEKFKKIWKKLVTCRNKEVTCKKCLKIMKVKKNKTQRYYSYIEGMSKMNGGCYS